jgi:alginate O-acetyltransferase complex protein AlgI
MLLGGLWHGANWTFVAWGVFHGAMLIFERLAGKKSLYARSPRVIQIALTFVLVLISWVFFRSLTISDAIAYLGAMFGREPASPNSLLVAAELYGLGRLLQFGICAVLIFAPWQAFEWVERLSWLRCLILLVLFAVSVMTMFTQAFNPFLYFQF